MENWIFWLSLLRVSKHNWPTYGGGNPPGLEVWAWSTTREQSPKFWVLSFHFILFADVSPFTGPPFWSCPLYKSAWTLTVSRFIHFRHQWCRLLAKFDPHISGNNWRQTCRYPLGFMCLVRWLLSMRLRKCIANVPKIICLCFSYRTYFLFHATSQLKYWS